MKPSRIWGVLALVYVVFFSWYTSFGGPLTDEEIAHYMGVLEQIGGDAARLDVWRAFMESDTGDDFVMLNVIDYRDEPAQVEGVEPGDTSADVMAKYSEPFLGKALLSAAHPVLMGTAAAPAVDLWGIEGAERWNWAGLVRYRSRRDVMKQAEYVSTLDIHRFKIAAIEKKISYPLDPFFQAGDPRFLLALLLLVAGLSLQLRAER